MGASLPALIQWHACEARHGLCRYGAAAWGEGGARGGLDKLTKGRARGGRARLTLARPRQGGGLCRLAAACWANGRGAAASLTWCGVCARFVARTWAHPAPLGRPAARTADRAKGRRVLSGTRRPTFSCLVLTKVRNPRNEGAKCCAPLHRGDYRATPRH
jgi:hypothetical protein